MGHFKHACVGSLASVNMYVTVYVSYQGARHLMWFMLIEFLSIQVTRTSLHQRFERIRLCEPGKLLL